MRTLIIDNYDSFTYNLFQYLAEINGTEPLVVRNDAPGWQVADLAEFDNVIISPGPGRPGRASDFGFSRDVVLGAPIPLLGVCLGHQGLCELSGGTVGSAPELFHGRESDILHDGLELFAGLPSPLRVVRYHSLTVTRVPNDLKVVARTGNGVVMGVRHRYRPAWGVQFHPESIRTEHGMDLLRNFARLTQEWHEHHPARSRAPRTSRPSFSTVARCKDARAMRVLVTQQHTPAPTEVVFHNLYSGAPQAFWLDSSRQDSDLCRFSFLGDASGPLARIAYADVWQRTVTVHTQGKVDVHHSGFFDWLDNDLRSLRVEAPELPFEFALGWVGYLGYELKAECGGRLVHRSENPDAAMLFADRGMVVDHLTGTTYLLALTDSDNEISARNWLRSTRARLTALAGALRLPAVRPFEIGDLSLRHDRSRYLELIGACHEAIKAGESYEVCLTNMVVGKGPIDPWQAYRMLRAESPVPFGAWLRFGDLFVLSTSPERFIRVSGDRIVESRPAFPGGSMTGAADLAIVIRTLVITPGAVSVGVGGAITALSDADAEFEETMIKASAITSVLSSRFPRGVTRARPLSLPYRTAWVPCSGRR